MRKTYHLITFLFLSFVCLYAQTTREEVYQTIEKTGGVYYAYPAHEITPQTPAPKGYKPFYISHVSRHGSRYLIDDESYQKPLKLLADADKANALTPLGKDVYARLQKVWEEAEGRGGDLSPLGVREQRGIAERMYTSFPEVFAGNAPISARSTLVVRCVLSMDAFCERLKELNPSLQTTREASNRYMPYLNNHTEAALEFRRSPDTWREQYRKFEEEHVKPDRLVSLIFSDQDFITKRVNPKSFMWSMFNIANNTQNMETDVCLYDLFEKEELFDLFQCVNYSVYVQDANAALNGGIMMENAKPFVKNIIDSANEAIASGKNSATLRFAHDGNLIPLALLMHLDGCYNSVADPADFYKAFSTFKVAPMAGNIQIIFFRKNESDDILVKFLHNEKETFIPPVESDILPYYHWKDIESFYTQLLHTSFGN
ncbi:MAG: histidine phosphatase family protein [Tannerellaceae bacterium]|nr:histidine phosphatase family protein [Tannerellaceae bacterium]